MKKVEVKIKQKDKGTKDLSLLNLRDEIVNFLYKDTVAHSTKTDLQFFILLYFIAIKIGDKTFLEKILDDGLPKFNKLNEAFLAKKGYLRGGQYRNLVEEQGLSELFENDIFLVLIEGVLRVAEIKKRYTAFLKKHSEIEKVIDTIATIYTPRLNESFKKFQSKRIQNDRTDENGNTHDLSMSVYRTVRMRNSRNLDMNLQKYTSVCEITSQSPIDLTFLQHIDPQIIFDLWNKYQVTEYMRSMWRYANHTPIVAGAVGGALGTAGYNSVAGLVTKFATWNRIDGKRNRADKDKAHREFEEAKKQDEQVLDDLTLRLVDSVLKSKERLEKEIDELKTKQHELTSQNVVMQDKAEIKTLEGRIAQLENLEVSTKMV
jgi:hypothetical protein